MQISRVYSNLPNLFSPVDFNCGQESSLLNVVLGEVRKPKDKEKDSHNLGKTTLIHLIDFLLLSNPGNDFFLQKHLDRFGSFIFYIEVALNAGDFATVRRSSALPGSVALVRHPDQGQDWSTAEDPEWDHVGRSVEEARTILDAWFDLAVLRPYDFRKAITYFLRAQDDWSDELQLRKFMQGKDRHWKPFVAQLFGLNGNLVTRKYDLDDDIQIARSKLQELQSEVQFREDDLPALVSEIAGLRGLVEDLEGQVDAFHFDIYERRMIDELVNTIEAEVSEVSTELYNARYDLRQIDVALSHRDNFDIDAIEVVFKETKIHFPLALKKQYEDLVAFNKKVTQDRNQALRARKKKLEARCIELEGQKLELDNRRASHLSVVRSSDTFGKFKAIQKELSSQKANLEYRESQRKKLEAVAEFSRGLREKERDRGRIVDEMKAMIAREATVVERFQSIFSRYCQQVLDHRGVFHFSINGNGNLEYRIGLEGKSGIGQTSSQSEGTSYKKIVCALFDLALLKLYENASFFRFVYHDGILEALDNRRKIAMLAVVRDQIKGKRLQYILTLIDADMPRDANGKRIKFPEEEVIVRLHDEGDDGRLFRMVEF